MEKLINAIANIGITISVSLFIIAVFGSNNKAINKLTFVEKWMVRIGLSVTACGALYNVLTLSVPPTSELIMNVGLAILFSWAVLFHFKYFIKKKKK
jgi:hypothetical protein